MQNLFFILFSTLIFQNCCMGQSNTLKGVGPSKTETTSTATKLADVIIGTWVLDSYSIVPSKSSHKSEDSLKTISILDNIIARTNFRYNVHTFSKFAKYNHQINSTSIEEGQLKKVAIESIYNVVPDMSDTPPANFIMFVEQEVKSDVSEAARKQFLYSGNLELTFDGEFVTMDGEVKKFDYNTITLRKTIGFKLPVYLTFRRIND